MREVIITVASPEDVQHARRLLAVEGYVDLGMYKEAEAELREVDPSWFVFEQTLVLQLRVYAGLHQWRKAHALATVLAQVQE